MFYIAATRAGIWTLTAKTTICSVVEHTMQQIPHNKNVQCAAIVFRFESCLKQQQQQREQKNVQIVDCSANTTKLSK